MAWKFNPFTGSLDYYEADTDTDTGEVNTASNLTSGAGTEADSFKSKVGVDLQFRTLKQGAGITLTENANDITIASPTSPFIQSFTSTMNYYNFRNDSDLGWLIVNNDSNFKLGGTDIAVDDEETATLSSANQTIIRTAWFLAPFDMTVTNISGMIMDDDWSNHADAHYIGIWVVEGFGSSGNTPTQENGTLTFILKYITQDYVSGTALGSINRCAAFYDSSPSLALSAGDAVWAGHLQTRFDGNDDMTLTMTICATKD